MKIAWALWTRRLHRWGTPLIALPLLVVLLSGILLLWKKDVAWIQPPTRKGAAPDIDPALSFQGILEAAQTSPEADITSWDDVDRLDVRPSKGVVKVRGKNGWEVQVDLANGEVLQTAYRRSDLIEAIHDGSWFHDAAKLGIVFPTALVLLGLYLTGLYLFYLPIRAQRAKRRRRQVRVENAPALEGSAHV